jgi:hypothetical protein
LEIAPLKISDQYFPFRCSISVAIQDIYASAAEAAREEQSMDTEEVLGYLRSIEDYALGPMDAIRAQTEAVGDPSLPQPDQVATLEWLQKAYTLWCEEFPVEEPLATHLKKILPAAAAHAITDSNFTAPGAHPLHQLFDTIHDSAIGWQAKLGRAGAAFETLIETVATQITDWFETGEGDLPGICEETITKAIKDQDRAKRMTQRLVETEKGKFRSASARWKSAEMINTNLANFSATAEIGSFLKGPWYESAQLVLLKFGADSAEWAGMTETTRTLLDSLQIDGSAEEDRRQQLFELVTSLPKNIKRWLLSLHMDTESVNDAMGMIELTHLHLLRQQPIELEQIEPLPMEGMSADRTMGSKLKTIESLSLGQWFVITTEGEENQRVQLVLKLGQEQLLQFANKAGIKTMQHGYGHFCNLLAEGKATALRSGTSFSLCLAAAAGIKTDADAEKLINKVMPEIEEARERERERKEAELLQSEQTEAARLQRENESAENAQREKEAAEKRLNEQRDAEKAQLDKQAKETREQLQRELQEKERFEQNAIERQNNEKENAEKLKNHSKAVDELRRESDAAAVRKKEAEDANKIRIAEYMRKKQEREQRFTGISDTPQYRSAEKPTQVADSEIRIPMGTWLGFHDGDTPLMAKLAVHDREQDSYIFVNREGIKMRSLNKRELLNLMENNLVDILEARSNFRDPVTGVDEDPS